MEDWRKVEAVWEKELIFNGVNGKGESITMSGSGNGFSPMELLLLGLAGCTGIDVVMILEKKRQKVDEFKVIVRGMRRDEIPRIYTKIEVEYLIRGNGIDRDSIEQAIRLSEEKYCSASHMLGQSAEIISTYKLEPS